MIKRNAKWLLFVLLLGLAPCISAADLHKEMKIQLNDTAQIE